MERKTKSGVPHMVAAILVGVAMALVAMMFMGDMVEVMLSGLMLNVTRLAVAAIAVFVLLRVRDQVLGVKIHDVMDKIEGDANASALYFGFSVIGFCLLAGLVFS